MYSYKGQNSRIPFSQRDKVVHIFLTVFDPLYLLVHLKDCVENTQLYWLCTVYWMIILSYVIKEMPEKLLLNKEKEDEEKSIIGETREDNRKEQTIKIVTKVNRSCVCGRGWYCITLTRITKNKGRVMEICLFLRQPGSHDNCCSGWHRRRHIHKSGVARINTHTYTHTIPPSQLDSPLFLHKKVFQSSPAAHLTPFLVFVPSLSTWGELSFPNFPQVKWQLTSRPLWCFKKLLSHRRPPSVSQFVLSCPFLWAVLFFSFFLSLLSFSLFPRAFQHSKHWKGFNRQVVLNQPTNQLICLFVTLPWVFFRGCF